MKFLLLPVLLFAVSSISSAAELKIVSLHPLMSDLLRNVGGEHVEVVDLIGLKSDPHSFEPKAEDLRAAGEAELYFVSGMGLETYLPKLEAIMAGRARIVEVGKTLPELHGSCDHEGHDHHADDDHNHEIDPHWWHSVDLFRRAVGVVADELAKADPLHADDFLSNASVYRAELDVLEKWVKRELVRIPKERRTLVTAHAAFQYFCDAYGFASHSVQGLNREQMPGAIELAGLIEDLKKDKVTAIFPEKESNPKMLKSLTRDTGIKLGGELIADGRGMTSYEEMMRRNVRTIVEGLGGK